MRNEGSFIERFGGPEVFQYGDLPDPVASSDEVVIDIAATSVNAADWKFLRPAEAVDHPGRPCHCSHRGQWRASNDIVQLTRHRKFGQYFDHPDMIYSLP
jgi:hypothetical protein